MGLEDELNRVTAPQISIRADQWGYVAIDPEVVKRIERIEEKLDLLLKVFPYKPFGPTIGEITQKTLEL